ncbi:MAG: hypothetical protein AB1414_16130 [bacterium]
MSKRCLCEQWEYKEDDKYCSNCGMKLISMRVEPDKWVFCHQDDLERIGVPKITNEGVSRLNVNLTLEKKSEEPDWLNITESHFELEGGKSKHLPITFDLKALDSQRDYERKIIIASNEPNPKHPFLLFKVEQAPKSEILTQSPLDLGEVVIGETKRDVIRIKNIGGGILEVGHPEISPKLGNLICIQEGIKIYKGEIGEIEIMINPKGSDLESKGYEGEIKFNFNKINETPSILVKVSLERPPQLRIEPRVIEFRGKCQIEKGTDKMFNLKLVEKSKTFEIKNIGGGELRIEKIEIEEPEKDWIEFKDNMPNKKILKKNETKSITVEVKIDKIQKTEDSDKVKIVANNNQIEYLMINLNLSS